ncbi:MAG: hypothetical protein ACE5IO_10625, partial [Thermoplasmata archaeon]
MKSTPRALFYLALSAVLASTPVWFVTAIAFGDAEDTARYVGQSVVLQGSLIVKHNFGVAPECMLVLESDEQVGLELRGGGSCPTLISGVEVRIAGSWRTSESRWVLAVDDYEIVSSIQTTGRIEILVILIEFSDIQHDSAYSVEYFQDLLFSDSAGSMKSYYSEAA